MFLRLVILFTLIFQFTYSHASKVDVKDVIIKRDKWGVPHIYGETDKDVAYGLAWAQMEDDAKSVQENIMSSRSRLGESLGKDGAIVDYLCHLFDIRSIVEENYETSFSTEFKSVLAGYVQGCNAYLKKHPEVEAVKNLFPVDEHDVIVGYVFGMMGMTNVHFDLINIFNGTIKRKEKLVSSGKGSNGFAVNYKRTENGRNFLAINSHQPLEGPQSWYECHLKSKEGWNMLGGTFPGGVTIFHGVSTSHGWAHTVNWPDLDDVYKLKMHPTQKYKYEMDGEWLDLEVKKVKLKVKWWIFKIPVQRKVFKSIHGPVLKHKKDFYAVRSPAIMNIKAAEQWFRMNKSTDFASFKAALNMNASPGLNTVYTNNNGDLFYLSAGFFPERNAKYDWYNVLPGNKSELIWEAVFDPIDSLPQCINPTSGYIFNTNATPFNSSADEDNPNAEDYNPTYGYTLLNNNRSLRLKYLLEQDSSLTYEEFKTIKFDRKFMKPAYTWLFSNIEHLINLDPQAYPKLANEIELIRNWDREAHPESEAAGFLTLTIKFLISELLDEGRISNRAEVIEDEQFVRNMLKAKKHIKKYFKTDKIKLGELQRHIRGDVDLPLGGMPDVIAAASPKDHEKGRLVCDAGDSYIMLAQFDSSGLVHLETINAFGSSNVPQSPHYTDQMQMFVNQELKEMSLNDEWIEANLERAYHPGQ